MAMLTIIVEMASNNNATDNYIPNFFDAGNPFLVDTQVAWEGRIYVVDLNSITLGDVLFTDISV